MNSLEDAVQRGWTFCVNRDLIEQAQQHARNNFPDRAIRRDPQLFGGDGLPGFSFVPNATNRALLQINSRLANRGRLDHCHAAIGFRSDLDALQANGRGCNLVAARELFVAKTGIPVSPMMRQALGSLSVKLQAEGQYERLRREAQPISQCRGLGLADWNTHAISIFDLTGVWVVTLGFVLIGLLITAIEGCTGKSKKRASQGGAQAVFQCERFDQNGRVIRTIGGSSSSDNQGTGSVAQQSLSQSARGSEEERLVGNFQATPFKSQVVFEEPPFEDEPEPENYKSAVGFDDVPEQPSSIRGAFSHV